MALPLAPLCRTTSTSTVGLPLESRTSLPITFSILIRYFNIITPFTNNNAIISKNMNPYTKKRKHLLLILFLRLPQKIIRTDRLLLPASVSFLHLHLYSFSLKRKILLRHLP